MSVLPLGDAVKALKGVVKASEMAGAAGKKVLKEALEDGAKKITGEGTEKAVKELFEETSEKLGKEISETSAKGAGKLTGKLDGLTQAERTMVDDLLKQGKNVELIPKDPAAKLKTPDFKINGVPTELKTIANPNVNTVITKIQNGFQQNAQRVLIDARNSGLTAQQAQEAITRTVGSYKNSVPGGIEIWYSGGVITYP